MTQTQTPDHIFALLKAALVELFEIDAFKVRPAALLREDLDLDSIDAVDLMLKLKALTGKSLSPETFKQVKTVQDVVTALHAALQK